jgi:hypothetical protein
MIETASAEAARPSHSQGCVPEPSRPGSQHRRQGLLYLPSPGVSRVCRQDAALLHALLCPCSRALPLQAAPTQWCRLETEAGQSAAILAQTAATTCWPDSGRLGESPLPVSTKIESPHHPLSFPLLPAIFHARNHRESGQQWAPTTMGAIPELLQINP